MQAFLSEETVDREKVLRLKLDLRNCPFLAIVQSSSDPGQSLPLSNQSTTARSPLPLRILQLTAPYLSISTIRFLKMPQSLPIDLSGLSGASKITVSELDMSIDSQEDLAAWPGARRVVKGRI